METKICTKCGLKKPVEEYYLANSGKNYDSCCKPCRLIGIKKYNLEHKERYRKYHIEYCKEYRLKNKEYSRAYWEKYASEHKEAIRERAKKYVFENKVQRKKYNFEYHSKSRKDLDDSYLRALICNKTGLKAQEISENLLKLKRKSLFAERVMKALNEKDQQQLIHLSSLIKREVQNDSTRKN